METSHDMDTLQRTASLIDRLSSHLIAHRTIRSERAASLVEYALLVALIAVVMVGAVTFLGDTTTGSLDRSGSSILTATS